MIVVHEIQHGAQYAIRALLAVRAEIAGRHRAGYLVPTDRRRVAPQTLVAVRTKRRADGRAQREYPGEVTAHRSQRIRGLHVEALRLVLLAHGGAGIERLAWLQVLAVVPAMRPVHDQVLHEDAVDTGVLLHRARQAIAIMQRVEQVVARDGHDGVSQPVYAVEVVERPALLAWHAGADRVEVAQ